MVIQPNIEWYLRISNQQGLSPRCPFASVYRCPRFYQSLSLLGEVGSTKIDPVEDNRLNEEWKKTDVWPTTREQATSVSGPKGESKHFSIFCPEVLFDRFCLFTEELYRYADDIDKSIAHKELIKEGALPNDWRWSWSHVKPTHYTECLLYSLLKAGKLKNAPKPTFPDIDMPDSITEKLPLVGAKLEIALPNVKFDHHGFSVADAPGGRKGDFLIGDTAIHVTTAPTEALMRKCCDNLASGLRPLVITTQSGVGGAGALAKNAGVSDGMDILEIEQFVATNIFKWSTFQKSKFTLIFRQLIESYNRIIDDCETDPSLKIIVG